MINKHHVLTQDYYFIYRMNWPELYVIITSHTCLSESTLYSCRNLKKLPTRNRRDISSLSDSNGIRTHKHLFVNEHSTI